MTANGSGDPFAVDNPYALDALTFAWGDEYDEIWVHGGEWCAHHKDGHDEKPPAPSLSRVGGFVVSGCLLRCLSAEAEPVTEVYDSVRVAHGPEVRADLDSPLSLMPGERQTPGVLDSADHSPLNVGVAGRPHLADRLPGFRVIVRVRDKLESIDCRPQGLARSNQGV